MDKGRIEFDDPTFRPSRKRRGFIGNGGIPLDLDSADFVSVVVTANGHSWRMAIKKDALATLDWEAQMQQALARVL